METSSETTFEGGSPAKPLEFNTGGVAARLAKSSDEIIKRWEIKVRAMLPAAYSRDSTELRNSLPKLLTELADILSSAQPREMLQRLNEKISREHGVARARQKGYSLAQVIEEYQILRKTIFEVLEQDHRLLNFDERNLILDTILTAIRNAASEYERLRYYEGIESDERQRQSENRYEVLKRSIPGYQEVPQSTARVLLGPALSLAAVVLAEVLSRRELPNPIYIQFLAVAFSSYFGGLWSGIFGVVIVSAYAATNVGPIETLEVAFTSLGVAFIIGFIRWRVFNLSRDAIREADKLLSVRAVTEQRLRDLHDQLDNQVQAKSAELDRNQQLFHRLIEGVKDYAIFTIDPDGNITTWNEGAVRMSQYSVGEAVGSHFSMFYNKESKLRNEPMAHLAVARTEGRFRGEGIRVRKNGEEFLADVLITPMLVEGKLVGYSKVVQDLSERKQLIQERDFSIANVDELKRDLAEREEFVAALSHDLRNPLTSARASAELIARRRGVDPHAVELSGKIVANITRADQMISALLDAYRLQAGKNLELEIVRLNIKDVIDTAVDELTATYGDRFNIQLENREEAGQPICGYWDREAILRILENLLTNALKYGDPQSRVNVKTVKEDGRIYLSVHNLGNPISIADQDRLFRQYERGRSIEVAGQKGWGLGLTLVRALVDAHHGFVKVESYPKSGTTFTVDLPLDARKIH